MTRITVSWKDKAGRIKELIEHISTHHGGDDSIWLNQYIREVVKNNKDALDKALDCFELVYKELGLRPIPSKKNQQINICAKCGYVPPFCCCIE